MSVYKGSLFNPLPALIANQSTIPNLRLLVHWNSNLPGTVRLRAYFTTKIHQKQNQKTITNMQRFLLHTHASAASELVSENFRLDSMDRNHGEG